MVWFVSVVDLSRVKGYHTWIVGYHYHCHHCIHQGTMTCHFQTTHEYSILLYQMITTSIFSAKVHVSLAYCMLIVVVVWIQTTQTFEKCHHTFVNNFYTFFEYWTHNIPPQCFSFSCSFGNQDRWTIYLAPITKVPNGNHWNVRKHISHNTHVQIKVTTNSPTQMFSLD